MGARCQGDNSTHTHKRGARSARHLAAVRFFFPSHPTHPPTQQSTLLKVLACSISGGEVRGAIYVNGAPVVAKEFRAASAVVWQRDILMSTATVREAIMTSAQLRLPQSMSRAEKRRRVDHIIAELVSLVWERRGEGKRESERNAPHSQHTPLIPPHPTIHTPGPGPPPRHDDWGRPGRHRLLRVGR